MSKRKAAALSPPLEQTANEGGPRRSARLVTAAPRTEEPPVAVAAAATQPTAAAASVIAVTGAAAAADPAHGQRPTAAAAADSSAVGAATRGAVSSSSPFVRLAVVELQLVLHGCDRRALMALARCSRSTLAAAAHPFAWRSLPLRLHCSRPSELTAWRPLHSVGSLLRHADLNDHWTLESAAAATVEEVAAVLALPRLRSLAVKVAHGYGRSHNSEPIVGSSASIQLVNALRSQLDCRRPSSNFVLSLNLSEQQIGAAGVTAVADLIEHSQSLTRLDLEGNKAVQGDALVALAHAAGKSSSLRSLNLDECGEVNVAAAAALGRALAQSCSLAELELSRLSVGAAGVKALSPGVKASSSLQRLHLSNHGSGQQNMLGDDGIAALAAAVAESRSFTELGLFGCSMSGDGMAALTAALQQCSSMRELLLDANWLDGAGMAALCRLLSSAQCNLALLDLATNTIGDADMAALAESLQSNTSLTELRLPNSPNLAAFIAPLAAALQCSGGSSALRTLLLGETPIGPSGVAALSDLLRSAPGLERLHVDMCALSLPEVAALAPAIGISSLTRLDFCNNESLADAGLAALVPGLCACPGLRHLMMWGCKLTLASAASLVRIVQQCRALELLQLGNNKIGDDGFCAIFAALHSESSLRCLFFGDNDIGVRAVAALADALSRGWNPTKLDLDPRDDVTPCVLALAAALEQCGPALRLEWLRMWSWDPSVDAAVALVRAVHRCPNMRVLDIWYFFDRDNHAALAAVRAVSRARPDIEVSLLDQSVDIDADDTEAQ